jgi:S-(hydroxymethyl)glutathione dehydrogenase/alcohol dehydrogenase
MKAAICYETGKPLTVEEVEIGVPQKGQVKVRLAATAICHSDIHDMYRGSGRGLSAHLLRPLLLLFYRNASPV